MVADILMQMQQAGLVVEPIGYLDDNVRLTGTELLGLPVLGKTGDLGQFPHESVVIGIGNNAVRRRLYCQLLAQGESLPIARHPSAVVSAHASIGPGSVLCAGAVVNPGSHIGANVILNTGCTVDHHNRIGDHVHIAPGAHLGGDTIVGEGSLIGIGAIVLPQIHIGRWTLVGAGSVVTISLPDSVVAVGVPARIKRTLHKEA